MLTLTFLFRNARTLSVTIALLLLICFCQESNNRESLDESLTFTVQNLVQCMCLVL